MGGWRNSNFQFAAHNIVNAEEEEDATVLTDRLDTVTTSYTIAISPEKTK